MAVFFWYIGKSVHVFSAPMEDSSLFSDILGKPQKSYFLLDSPIRGGGGERGCPPRKKELFFTTKPREGWGGLKALVDRPL